MPSFLLKPENTENRFGVSFVEFSPSRIFS